MNTRKIRLLFLSIALISLVTACGGDQPAATSAPTRPAAVAATSQPAVVPATEPTVAAPTATAAIKPGFITGKVYLMSPPTPHMAVYAVDLNSGAWVLTETNPTDGPVDFSLTVPPGSYQVFAFADDANIHAYVGYEKIDGWGLGTVTVAADQTVADIVVRSPGASECGMTFGVPASPDGRFAAVAGPSADCVAALTATATAATATAPTTATVDGQTGFITGHVQLMSPPTPVMFVYALDSATRVWVMVQTQPTDGPAPFTLEVQPGSYQVFAAAEGWSTVGVGYSQDNLTLTTVTVAAGQTVADIIVRSPSQGGCGQMPGYPASPDGRFAAVPGPAADCLARLAAGDTYSPVSLTVCETLQEIATQTLDVPFALEPKAAFVDYLNNERGYGCTLTATGTGAKFSDPVTVMTDLVNAFVGWTEQPDYQANGPTGAATGLTRDMGLMLVSAEWMPAPGVQCPSDQPIAACELTPEQRQYTIQIKVAQK